MNIVGLQYANENNIIFELKIVISPKFVAVKFKMIILLAASDSSKEF